MMIIVYAYGWMLHQLSSVAGSSMTDPSLTCSEDCHDINHVHDLEYMQYINFKKSYCSQLDLMHIA